MLALVLPALAAPPAPQLAVVDGALWPGRAATLEVGALDAGAPRASPPQLTVSGGSVQGPTQARAGVWQWRLTPAIDAARVEVSVDGALHVLALDPPPASGLTVAGPVDAQVGTPQVRFVVGSASGDVVPVDALEVFPAEGQVVGLTATDHGVEVELALDDRPYPRWVPVAVRDRRRDEQPAWVDVRVRARPRLPMVAEPGAKLTLKVGGRSYGPFVAGPDGLIEGRVDQNPGDVSASAVLLDDLGNETRTELPLVGQVGAALLATASGEFLPGRSPPVVLVRAVDPGGGPPRTAPVCKAPSGILPSRSLPSTTGGVWLVPLPSGDDPVDVRVACSLGTSSAEVRVPVTSAVPVRLGLRVWPDELLADFPVADVSVVLDDARGERVDVSSGIELHADHGTVTLAPPSGIVARGEYDGSRAVEAGEDHVGAKWFAPAGSGPVEELVVRWGPVPRTEGTVVVHVRALDRMRRPLGGVPVAVRLGSGAPRTVTTVANGWGSAELAADGGGRPFVVEAASGRAVHRAVLLPGDPARGGPGEPDLTAVQTVHLRPGRVEGISIEVDPTILRAGPGAVAWVYVKLEDAAGQAVTDEPVEIVATEGSVGEPHVRDDGTWVAEYTPLPAEGSRQVEITARTSTVRSTAHLALEPRVVRLAFGPWFGARTNFGVMPAATAGFDVDFRLRSRFMGESLVLRAGVSATRLRSEVETEYGPASDLRSTLVPMTAALLFRTDPGRVGIWGGGGPMVGPDFVQVRFGDKLVTRGQSLLVGAMLTGGVGVPAPGGEVAFTVLGSWLPAPSADVGYSGNLGSMAAGLGYRLVY